MSKHFSVRDRRISEIHRGDHQNSFDATAYRLYRLANPFFNRW